MALLSPNGRFLAAAAFTADVKVSHSHHLFLLFFNYNYFLHYTYLLFIETCPSF